jgi:hypothetical protein
VQWNRLAVHEFTPFGREYRRHQLADPVVEQHALTLPGLSALLLANGTEMEGSGLADVVLMAIQIHCHQ